jgi:integrase
LTRRKTLSDLGVQNLKSKSARYVFSDPELGGHYVRVMPTGSKSFVALARDPNGKQVWATIGATNLYGIEKARELAREAIKRIKAGFPPFEQKEKPDIFKDVVDDWLKRHVQQKGLRSEAEVTRLLNAHVLPVWKDRLFHTIRRSDVTALLDEVEDDHGPRQADYVLAIVRGIMNWYAVRHDDYQPPIARGMRRTDPKSRKRARVLDDEEIRAVWALAERNGPFGAIIRLALLTAQRREKIGAMKWDDISADGVWLVPSEARQKGVGGALRLPELARKVIAEQHRIGENPYVFPGRGNGHFQGWSPCKRRFDEKLLAALRTEVADQGGDPEKVKFDPWVIHDLRRTARSLMARAGVRPDIAERVMGHVIPGVEGVYDRHTYGDEKAAALNQLASLIETITNSHPPERYVQHEPPPRGRGRPPHRLKSLDRESLVWVLDELVEAHRAQGAVDPEQAAFNEMERLEHAEGRNVTEATLRRYHREGVRLLRGTEARLAFLVNKQVNDLRKRGVADPIAAALEAVAPEYATTPSILNCRYRRGQRALRYLRDKAEKK